MAISKSCGHYFNAGYLFNDLRGIDFDGDDRSIDAKISRVRRKLQEDPDHPTWIKTVRGKGYLFTLDTPVQNI